MVKASLSNAEGGSGSIPDGAAKIPYASWSKQRRKTKHKDRSNIVTHSIMTLKMVRIKKKKKSLKQPLCYCSTFWGNQPRIPAEHTQAEKVKETTASWTVARSLSRGTFAVRGEGLL